ncbi:MAG: hypothetical protein ACW98Y_16680 [Candidatus Thorarchaeota archaeon]|jgi:hypothetical protein
MAEEPPSIEEVLPSNEVVEWAGKKRADFDYCCPVTIAFVVFLFVGGSFSYTIFEDPSQFLTFLPLQIIGSIFCIIALYVRIKNVRWHPPWYFITSKRILETRGKQIVTEIDRSRFGDASLHECISIRLDHHANERHTSPVNDITIHDPKTSEPLIVFDKIWFVYTSGYELFYDMQVCPSCEVEISSKLEKCLACGQSLV